MASALRILHISDSHIGAGMPRRPRLNVRRRGDDILDAYHRVLGRAAEHNVQLVIHAGDLFDTPAPSAGAITAAAEPLLALASDGICVVIVPGNHERSAIPASLLLAHPNIHVVREPTTLRFRIGDHQVAVAAVPCIRRTAGAAFGEALRQTKWHEAHADVNILAAHQSFESARCGPANYRFRSGDDVVERGDVPAGFHYVAAGHVHRHQVLATPHADGPPIVYAGSPDRISFAERDEPKGCVLVEANGSVTHRFLEHPVRPMCAVPLDVTGMDRIAIRNALEKSLASLLPGALARISITGRTNAAAIRGLRAAQTARALRPDTLVQVSTRSLEFTRPGTTNGARRREVDAFRHLDAPQCETIRAERANVASLPTATGVYALHDAAGHLLYVGKAKNLRTRIRTHIRGKTASASFDGWTDRIAHIHVRRAYSDLEASLVEAELIRKLRPPFNRQMRAWQRYCFIVESDAAHGDLVVAARPDPSLHTFGPYRSKMEAEAIVESAAALFQTAQCPPADERPLPLLEPISASIERLPCIRYEDHRCAAPCAARIDATRYADRLRLRDALLDGTDDGLLTVAEKQNEVAQQCGVAPDRLRAVERSLAGLRHAFDHAVVIRHAESLLGAALILPGPDRFKRVIIPTLRGLICDEMKNEIQSARRIVARLRSVICHLPPSEARRLPTHMLDALSVAARLITRGAACRIVRTANDRRVTARQLKSLAFGRAGDLPAPFR